MINLKHSSIKLLLECLEQHRPDLLYIILDHNVYEVDQKIGNELREAVLDEFVRSGLEEDYEPNEYGYKLEQLIDDIGRLFMKK